MNALSAVDWQPPLPRKGIFRILVCRPNHRLGNAVLMTPLMTELERHYQGAEIDVISEGDIAREVFASHFSIKNIYCLPKRGFKHPLAFLRLLLQVRRTHYDLIIDPCLGSGFSRAVTRLLHGTYKLGFGDQRARSGLTHGAPSHVATRHMAKRPVNLLRWALALPILAEDDYPVLDMRLTDSEVAQGRRAVSSLLSTPSLETARPVVGVFANATGAKRYPLEWWREFIDTFRTLCPAASIFELIPMHGVSMLGSEWPGYYSSDIRRMGAVMSAANLVITADCGLMHLAVASRVTTVGLFCATDPDVYEPYGHSSHAVDTRSLSAREVACRVVTIYSELLGLPTTPPSGNEQRSARDGATRHESPKGRSPLHSVASRSRKTP